MAHPLGPGIMLCHHPGIPINVPLTQARASSDLSLLACRHQILSLKPCISGPVIKTWTMKLELLDIGLEALSILESRPPCSPQLVP